MGEDELIALFVCFLPTLLTLGAGVSLVVWLVRRSPRLPPPQLEIDELRDQNLQLLHRVQRLEAAMHRVFEGDVPALRAAVPVSGPSTADEATPETVAAEQEAPSEPRAEEAARAAEESALTPAEVPAVAASVGAELPLEAEEGPAFVEPAIADGAGELPDVTAPPGDISAEPSGAERPETSDGTPVDAPPVEPPLVEPPPAAPPPRSGAPEEGWERWLGVRGAAAVGALVLVVAGLFFFQYTIEHGLIPPALRVVLGVGVGLGCIIGADLRLRRRYPELAQWLTGAGIAILYVSFWAGRALYELYPTWAASLAMIATTGACVALATARRAMVVAALGLLGGFLTPLALSTGEDRPIALFGYLLLLDAAMLWLAYQRRWSWLAIASLIGTAFYQVSWTLGRLDEPRLLIGVGILGVFGLAAALLPRRADTDEEGEAESEGLLWRATRAGGVLVPLLLAVHVSLRGDLGAHFWVTSALFLLLAAASVWVGVRHKSALLPSAATLVGVGSVLGSAAIHSPETALGAWQLALLLPAIALVFHVATEVTRGRSVTRYASYLATLSALATLLLLGPIAPAGGPWPWLAALALLAGIGLRQAHWEPRLAVGVGALIGFVAALIPFARAGSATEPPALVLFGLTLLAAALPNVVSFFPNASRAHRRAADHGAAAAAMIVLGLVPLWVRVASIPQVAFFVGAGLAAALIVLAALRLRRALWLVGAVLAHAFAIAFWVLREPAPFDLSTWFGALSPVLTGLAAALAPTTRQDPWSWRAAALAGPLTFLTARLVHLEVFGSGTVGLLAVLLAMLSAAILVVAHLRGPRDADARRTALAWASAATAGFVTLAIPLQLDNEWVTIGWALEVLALALIWRKLDHPGLKYFAVALMAAVSVRLLINPYVLDYYPRGDLRVINWLTYTYIVPAIALAGTWAAFRDREVARLRPAERAVFGDRAAIASLAATAAIGIVFVWVNLTIFDIFSSGRELTIPLDRLPARDLSLSLAWGVFALALLGLGMWRRTLAARIASLALILITSLKVFLYDLAHLGDLYRVASLVGLALSLFAISFFYKRFVFQPTTNAVEVSP